VAVIHGRQRRLSRAYVGSAAIIRCGRLRGSCAKIWPADEGVSTAIAARAGRREEARHILNDVYGWFTEGFDTADLRGAKTLLDEFIRSVELKAGIAVAVTTRIHPGITQEVAPNESQRAPKATP
jgi:hypothetical protein